MTEAADNGPPTRIRMPARTRSTFAARTARDDAEQLERGSLGFPSPSPNEETPLLDTIMSGQTRDGEENTSKSQRMFKFLPNWFSKYSRPSSREPANATPSPGHVVFGDNSLPSTLQHSGERKRPSTTILKPRPGAFPRPVGGTSKLGTFAGVFVPTTLNVLSILMFLRFGFILGQTGVVGIMGMLLVCYAINLLTTMSISAIATNGTVRGGGAYYLISRSLGPEFGGSIGLVFFLGSVFNTSMNAVGLIDCFIENFGSQTGAWSHWMLQGFWWQYIWATVVLVICTGICMAGSGIFARCSNGLLAILLLATLSIPFSALVMKPFESRAEGIEFTGLSLQTFTGNLMPRFTRGAAGSQNNQRENFRDLFGILFPATGGIFAGASMSGDLKHPSKAIPKGTLYGLILTFLLYTLVIFSMAASITRSSFYRNANVIQLTNISETVILLGEFATSAFSVLMGVIGSAKLLQALARDDLIPGLSVFGQGNQKTDDPIYAIILTYILAQLMMVADINEIASFITMAYLLTFFVTNLACFLLKVGSAPNFRPSFHFFNWKTAAVGAIASIATMFFVDSLYASGCVAVLILVFLIIHYSTPPKPWGDVSQSLIYHQVRKYLLRLRQEHVKFWRPQILLIVNDPRRQYKLIQFCNSLKKGALFVLGHVIVSEDFGASVPEARRQQASWTKYIDFSKIKAFVNVTISPAVEWGVRNIVLGTGLGGMRPNIVVMGFYNLNELRESKPLLDVSSSQPSQSAMATGHRPVTKPRHSHAKRSVADELHGSLPTDAMKPENAIGIQSYVTILEDLVLRLRINVAVAKGFQELEVPTSQPTRGERVLNMLHLKELDKERPNKKYIDLWPIQMSAEIAAAGETSSRKNVLTTNFDTYTLILQLGCILHTVPSWKRTYTLRVAVFVEYESDVEEERQRVTTLLMNLRIQAKVLVFWLASGDLKMYEVIINAKSGDEYSEASEEVDEALAEEEWWKDMQRLRRPGTMSSSQELAQVEGLLGTVGNWPTASFQHGRRESRPRRFAELKKLLNKTRRKSSISDLGQLGLTVGMRTQRLPADLVHDESSACESSSSADSDYEDNEGASENDLSEYDLDASSDSDSDSDRPITPTRRAKSFSTDIALPFLKRKFGLRTPRRTEEQQPRRPSDVTPLQTHQGATASDTVLIGAAKIRTSGVGGSPASSSASTTRAFVKPPPIRQQSLPKFTSKPTPRTKVAEEDGPGPSIMFTDQQSPTMKRNPMLFAADSQTTPRTESPGPTLSSSSTPQPDAQQVEAQAQAQAQAQSLPLSFNDLPCRAQHLILNELMRRHSKHTAVIFTTLPSPIEGTSKSEAESVKYMSDLEVLCLGLPPVLLVHSNSMTVTMNL
ncbi:hypothetical protein GQ43DRAFT_441210 [Delitschia confertaspora ATCC 74209]|uniref:Amino acid permease/ SLC12A domain-containing protein n=1 Tax=Delitschia confertaspora ATCC 74209 TaxID=1513339 RepID=A0A9P4JMA2_9PLEO|nr:hypothetical protein GQ43DRAFT_441210 [Delitschia confertaspora ATCC 74209]